MSDRRVVITGMGTVNPLGHNVAETWEAILACKSGVTPVELFDASTFPSTFAAQVKNYDLSEHIPDARTHQHAGRHCRFALGAAWEAWGQSALGSCEQLDRTRLGIYLGSGEGSLDFDNFTSLMIDAWSDGKVDTARWAELAFERMELYREVKQESNMVLAHLAAMFGARGPAFNVLTACAASTQAIGEAVEQVRNGDADVIISGGAHSMIHPYGMTGFNRLTALSTRNDDIPGASRPFDMTRDGFVLGEGASVLILEDYEFASARGADMLAEVIGYGASADAFRITDQDPEGDGAATAMRTALTDEVPVSSAKSLLGHLIAAAGATELITCVLGIRDQILPPTINQEVTDPDCDLDYIPNEPRKAKVDIAMSNSFGFGGQNNTLIIKKI
ncbi:MAG: beta-ketoacyl-[acyl-carrier-protein] synthase family protein [Planctomycetota bacterium]